MTDAKTFLTEFAQDILAHPEQRSVLIDGWSAHLQARDQSYERREVATRLELLQQLHDILNDGRIMQIDTARAAIAETLRQARAVSVVLDGGKS
jgi:predicted RNA binding protein with dsRBD fold (UPF0201 family)